jgi:hypothetical protein
LYADRHRFREYGMWALDGDDYFDVNLKYITFDNIPRSCAEALDEMRNALAIANITNRVLVLPEFDCKTMCRCSKRCASRIAASIRPPCFLADFFQVDNITASFQVREHLFLQNSRIKAQIEAEVAPVSVELTSALSETEVRDRFSSLNATLLRFKSLLYMFSGFVDNEFDYQFNQLVRNALPFIGCPKGLSC